MTWSVVDFVPVTAAFGDVEVQPFPVLLSLDLLLHILRDGRFLIVLTLIFLRDKLEHVLQFASHGLLSGISLGLLGSLLLGRPSLVVLSRAVHSDGRVPVKSCYGVLQVLGVGLVQLHGLGIHVYVGFALSIHDVVLSVELEVVFVQLLVHLHILPFIHNTIPTRPLIGHLIQSLPQLMTLELPLIHLLALVTPVAVQTLLH